MAAIYECPRCGAVTYASGIRKHDQSHADEDLRSKRVDKLNAAIDSLNAAIDSLGEGVELHEWPDGEDPR